MNFINQLVIERQTFLQFFWGGNDETFSFLHAWRLIDNVTNVLHLFSLLTFSIKLWDAFDRKDPIRLHCFITGNMAEAMLRPRVKIEGAFLFRFSSKGGLAADYTRRGSRGYRIEKVHWRFEDIPTVADFLKKLWDRNRDGGFLKNLVDLSQPFAQNCFPKEKVFPVPHSQCGYVNDDGDDKMEESEINAMGYSSHTWGPHHMTQQENSYSISRSRSGKWF